MDERLPKNERLLKASDFKFVFQNGTKYKGKYLLMFSVSGDTRKFGVVVSKKVSKKAVVRNKIKRCLREIYRTNKYVLPEGTDIVIVALAGAVRVNYNELEKDFHNVCKKAFA